MAQHHITYSSRLTDAQPLVIDGDCTWKVAQCAVAFDEQRLNAVLAEQISSGQSCRPGTNDDHRHKIVVHLAFRSRSHPNISYSSQGTDLLPKRPSITDKLCLLRKKPVQCQNIMAATQT